jgi:hypothetical protein
VRPPDLSGPARAWLIDDSKSREAHVREWGYEAGSLVTWIVNGPYHPLWSWWHVGVIHLRDIPGAPPANKQYPEAEYEFAIYSLDPSGKDGRPKAPDIDLIEAGETKRGFPGFLSPPDVQFHFHRVTDEQAIKICNRAVEHIVGGRSCDSDYREWWKAALAGTVEHFVLGVHE